MTLVKEKKIENAFFSVSERHGRASRGSKTVPLAEGKKIVFLSPKSTYGVLIELKEE